MIEPAEVAVVSVRNRTGRERFTSGRRIVASGFKATVVPVRETDVLVL